MKNLKLAAIETHVADARTCCLNPATSTHRQMTEEQLEDLLDLFDYDTPLFGRPLGTGDEIPVYPFVFAGIGLTAVLVLLIGRRRRKNEG